jgi:hypothetical protein
VARLVVVLGGGRLGEELAGVVQESAAARSAPLRQGTAPPYMGMEASSCAPATTEAGARSQTSAGVRDRGSRRRTAGHRAVRDRRVRVLHGGVRDFMGSLGARGALGRRAASVGGRPGSQGRRVALARRVRRASVATSRRGLVLGLQFQTRLLRACFSPNN